jgi:hypothetical protein
MAATRSREEKRRSNRYGRMFSALFFGLVLLVSGLAGYRLNKTPLTSDARWAGGPILSQIGAGVGLLALGIYWSRRLNDPRLNLFSRAPRTVKSVGAGQSSGAAMKRRPRLERQTGSGR